MPKIVQNASQRALERVFAAPANQAYATARQQQGSISGQIPGTTSPYNQTGVAYGLIQPGATGDHVAAVGHKVLANDGSAVVVMGNMKVTGASGHPPSGFQDGGFVFTDADGNAVAGYSHPTGLWGFGGGLVAANSNTDFIAADTTTALSADGALHNIPFPITSPPSWIDSSGNILTSGLYALGVQCVGGATPTTAGLWCQLIGSFQSWELVSLEAMQTTDSFGQKLGTRVIEIVGFNVGGWSAIPAVQMPTDATATVVARPFAWRIAY